MHQKKLDEKYAYQHQNQDRMDIPAVQSELMSTGDAQLERIQEELSQLSPNSPGKRVIENSPIYSPQAVRSNLSIASPRNAQEIKAELRILKKISKNIRLELSEMTPYNIQL